MRDTFYWNAHLLYLLTSIYISSANPWLDFLPPSEAHELALGLNDDLETYCATGPAFSDSSIQRLYGLGLLPLVPGISIPKVLECVAQIAAAPHLKVRAPQHLTPHLNSVHFQVYKSDEVSL